MKLIKKNSCLTAHERFVRNGQDQLLLVAQSCTFDDSFQLFAQKLLEIENTKYRLVTALLALHLFKTMTQGVSQIESYERKTTGYFQLSTRFGTKQFD